jgi:RHS repeat-associated protein
MVSETKLVTGSGTFLTGWSYNSADQVATMTYPGGNNGFSGEVVTYTYLPQLALNSLTGTSQYVTSTSYDAAGRIVNRQYNGGTNTFYTGYTYYAWDTPDQGGRLASQVSIKGTTTYQSFSYQYDKVGNIKEIDDSIAGTPLNPQKQIFNYDSLNRLIDAQAINGTYGNYVQEYYTYDSVTGNLSSKAGANYTYSFQVTCGDDLNPYTRTISHAVHDTSGGRHYTYDCNGNATQSSQTGIGNPYMNFTYDAENRVTGISGKNYQGTTVSLTSVYDGDGNRVKGTVGGTTTVYIGNYFEWTGSTMKKYYYEGAIRVAMRTGTSSPQYLLSDHLGSTEFTLSSSGTKQAELRYKAWGENRYTDGTTPTTFRYTGQRQESSLGGVDGLYYYGARWYDSSLGRFVSADSIIPGAGNPQAWDRYAYVLNNPIRLVDPSGHRSNQYYFDGDADWTWSQTWGITFTGEWNYEGGYTDLMVIQGDVEKVGAKLQQFTGQSASDSFKSVIGSVSIGMDLAGDSKGCFLTHCYQGTRGQLAQDWAKGLMIHELGHVFDNRSGASGLLDIALNFNDSLGVHITGVENGKFVRTNKGYKSATYPDEQHPYDPDQAADSQWNNHYDTPGEDFGDMFMNWVQASFDYSASANNAGVVRFNWMQTNMAEFVSKAQSQ